MSDKSLTFSAVERILTKLGFRHGTASAEDAKTTVPQVIFIHDRTETLFAFPANSDVIGPARVESMRRILVGRNVADENVINGMLDDSARITVA